MDRRALQAIVHGVTKEGTRLSDWALIERHEHSSLSGERSAHSLVTHPSTDKKNNQVSPQVLLGQLWLCYMLCLFSIISPSIEVPRFYELIWTNSLAFVQNPDDWPRFAPTGVPLAPKLFGTFGFPSWFCGSSSLCNSRAKLMPRLTFQM